MLINLLYLKEKFNLSLNSIIHVGAHNCQELPSYLECGAKKIYWVEANTELVKESIGKIDTDANKVIEAVISECDGKEVSFNIANNSQSSSLLDLGIHEKLFPDISYVRKESRITTKLDTIYKIHCNEKVIDLLNLDIQGAELLALKGFKQNLNRVRAIYTEINTKKVYKNCALVEDLDDFLIDFDFERLETKMWLDHPWGDAFYLRRD